VLRHIDAAALAAREARLSGHVSVGLASSTTGVLGLPFMRAMRERYPDRAAPGYWLSFAAVCGLFATLVLYRRGGVGRSWRGGVTST
jgi:hypothetical protein